MKLAEEFRSDNGGLSWSYINSSRSLRQRAWYYSKIYDTQDEDIVYVMNVSYHKSKDGKTFKSYDAPHGDHHDLWIAPEDNQRMIIGDDGGAQISFNAGKTWSTYYNQPTAQFIELQLTTHFLQNICCATRQHNIKSKLSISRRWHFRRRLGTYSWWRVSSYCC